MGHADRHGASVILCYFFSYLLFSLLTKIQGAQHGPAGVLLASAIGNALAWGVALALTGWWRLLRRGVSHGALVAGASSLLIVASSVVVYGEPRLSIVLPLLLMKGGVVLVGRGADFLRGRAVDARTRAVMLLTCAAVVAGVAPRLRLDGTAVALACAALYLAGYAVKLPALDAGKCDPLPFLVAETTVTTLLLLACCLPLAADASARAAVTPLAVLAGMASCGCGAFGGLILLRPAPHSLLVPLSRCTSLLAGLCAAWLYVRISTGSWRFDPWELAGASLMACALWVGSKRPSNPSREAQEAASAVAGRVG